MDNTCFGSGMTSMVLIANRQLAIAAACWTTLVAPGVAAQTPGTESNRQAASTSVGATATVLRPLAVAVLTRLNSGNVIGGNVSPGSIAIPASYQGSGSPAPTYVNIAPSAQKPLVPATAAQVLVSGTPNQAFTVRITGWVRTMSAGSITAPSASLSVKYYFGGAKTNSQSIGNGQLDSKGSATVGIGTTITLSLPKGKTGSVTYTPQVAVTYN